MRKVLFILFALLISGEIISQDYRQTIKEGNDFYFQKNYMQALNSYLKVVNQGFTSAELYFNIGNSYYRLNKLGYSILYYEKALRLSPNDEDIQFNLKLANSKTFDKLEEFPKIFLTVWWESLVSMLNYKQWAIVFIVLFWIFLAALGLYLLSDKLQLRRIGFYSSSFVFAALILVGVIFYESFHIETKSNEGVLIVESEVVKQSPDIQSNDAFIIHEGIKFVIEDNVGQWAKIKLIDGKVGWLQKSAFRKI